MKKLTYTFAGLAFIIGTFLGANYFFVGSALSDAIKSDSRNVGIEASAHYENYISTSVLVFDLKSVSDSNSPADIFRVFLQYASHMKSKRFDQVVLAHKGSVKFKLKGEYFKTLGEEFEDQNLVYTIRTFPENLYRPDGTQAFGTWTGGIIGVLGEQMNDFNKFHQDWYIKDMTLATTK
ncbi:hypothetical protein [Methylobacter tundripaludum]|uniref:hypothetical protein n=1 Tax=Methylobacter tundripaludum TaxID=173365 RepID=UPI000486D7B9|nr:hypothetical protein [Methylobacter tundripaludum]